MSSNEFIYKSLRIKNPVSVPYMQLSSTTGCVTKNLGSAGTIQELLENAKMRQPKQQVYSSPPTYLTEIDELLAIANNCDGDFEKTRRAAMKALLEDSDETSLVENIMKVNRLVIGYFHDCDCDDDYSQSVDSFRREQGGAVLFITASTIVLIFPNRESEEYIEAEWKSRIRGRALPSHFETVADPTGWIETWKDRMPITLTDSY